MNQALFQWILRQVDRAENRDTLEGQYGPENVAFRLTNRTSPKKSRQGIYFEDGDGAEIWLRIKVPGDEGEFLGIMLHAPDPGWVCRLARETEPHLETTVAVVPQYVVERLLRTIYEETGLPTQVDTFSWWYSIIAVRRKVLRWESNGRPVFASRYNSRRIKIRPLPPTSTAPGPLDLSSHVQETGSWEDGVVVLELADEEEALWSVG